MNATHPKTAESRGQHLRWASARWLLPALLGLGMVLGGCSTPQPRKRSFMGQARYERKEVSEPAGLNPLGALETCRPQPQGRQAATRVLISRPEFFTRDASQMIVSLREALANNEAGLETPKMQLSARPILSAAEARAEGSRCGALIVLWEQRQSQTLELTLPTPAPVPLRGLVQSKLCEFGGHSEQATILYYTILGLTAMTRNDYQLAHFYLNSAKEIDVECLHLPGTSGAAGPSAAARKK